jgi:hypothetical protein
MHNNPYWLGLRTGYEKLELIGFNERSDRLRVIMRLEHCIGWMTRLEHCIPWITRVELEYDELTRLKRLLAPWNFLTMTSDVKWLVVIFTTDCCTIRERAPGCHWIRGWVCHRTETNALGENLLPVPGIEPEFLDCPAHSITTILTKEKWLVNSNLQAFKHLVNFCPHHLEITVQRASEYKNCPSLYEEHGRHGMRHSKSYCCVCQ